MAAMGATPYALLLAMTIPFADEVWLDNFCKGFYELADQHSLELIGGDISKGDTSITVTVMGFLPEDQVLLRSGAKPGDLIYVSGQLGAAALAIRLLAKAVGIPKHHEEECYAKLFRPEPRVVLGQQLLGLASSAIDVSDGLYMELEHIVAASGGIGAKIFADRLPIAEPVTMNIRKENAVNMVLTTGTTINYVSLSLKKNKLPSKL